MLRENCQWLLAGRPVKCLILLVLPERIELSTSPLPRGQIRTKNAYFSTF